MTEYIIVNDATGLIVSKCSNEQIKTLFPFLTIGDPLEYWENLIKTTGKWAGNSLYKKV